MWKPGHGISSSSKSPLMHPFSHDLVKGRPQSWLLKHFSGFALYMDRITHNTCFMFIIFHSTLNLWDSAILLHDLDISSSCSKVCVTTTVYVPILLFIGVWLVSRVLTILKSTTAMNILVHTFGWAFAYISFRYKPRSRILEV